MNAVSLITALAKQDIRLWLEEGNLRYSAPEGAMTPQIIASLRESKQAIVDFLATAEKGQLAVLPVADRSQPVPVSSAQQRLWFLHRLEPENSAYHIHAALKIEGDLDPRYLGAACSAILERHEILRTHYEQQGGKVVQVINPPHTWQIMPEPLAAAAVDAALAAELQTRFDLGKNPLFRTRLWQLGDREHLLAFTVHHIAADGWSLGIFVNELAETYAALSRGEKPVLLPLQRQYADYAAWQHADDYRQNIAKQLEYWCQKLQGVPNLALPLDHARSIMNSNAGGFVDCELPQELAAGFRALNQQAGTTTFMGMMAALSALLYRYSNQADFCIGTPVAGRSTSQLEPLIGCFLNLLAIRCEPDAGQTFSSYLQAIKATCSEAFANQDAPFEQIVNALVKERDMAVSPLFQVLLSVQNAPFSQASGFGQLRITPYESAAAAAQFDLKLTVQEQAATIQLRFEYRKSLFNASTMARLADHFSILLRQVVANPQLPLHAINLFGDQPAMATLGLQPGGVNDTVAALPDDLLLHHLFEEQVQKTPDAVAVSDSSSSLTYRQLDNRANQLAHRLIANGQQPGKLVGVCLYRSVNMSVALLGILKAGCAYVPFDPEFPAERLAFMAEDTEASCIITSTATGPLIEAFSSAGLDIDTVDFSVFDHASPAISQKNNSLFNVIYTSGSTGKPKGVMVPHEGVANRLLWMQKKYPLTASDTVLQKTPYSFDVSVWELFWPLIAGSKYHYASPDAHKDPAAIRDLIIAHRITTLHFVPSMLGSFLNSHGINNCTSLRRIFCSGEALQLQHEKKFFEQLPNAALHNLYGPTEASIDVSWYDCGRKNPFCSVPIGRPIDNIQLHILDERLQPLPVGIAGELHIGGIGLARGYLNRDELTVRSFIANPWHAEGHPSERLYKSGDLARLTDEGEIIYLGRIDHQVKIRGNRIELGEIETALMQKPGIRDAVVVASQHQNNDSRLVAYYLADSEIEPQALVTHLAAFLPQYMIPASFMHLPAWPLTPSGKVNRNRLPAPDWNRLNRQPYVAPETDTEEKLAAIWSQVLGVEKVGINDNFFELGGHSLTAIQVLAMAQETFGVEVPVRKIFENPSIRPVAALIDTILLEQAVFSSTAGDSDDTESFTL